MDEIKKMVIATAMRKLFEGRYLDICTVDQCLKVAGVIAPREPYELLRTLHCVNYDAMPRELLEKVPTLLDACFGGISIAELLKACEPAQAKLGGANRKLLN